LGGAGLTTFLTVFAANTLQTKIAVPVKYDPLTPLPPEQS
jgi:hypothetical protein